LARRRSGDDGAGMLASSVMENPSLLVCCEEGKRGDLAPKLQFMPMNR